MEPSASTQTTSTGINGVGPAHERVDERTRDLVEHRRERVPEQAAGKRVLQREFDLARVLAQHQEAPFAFEPGERPFAQPHRDRLVRPVDVQRREALPDPAVVDHHRRKHAGAVVAGDLGAPAPRQEARIVLDAVDQLEHLAGAVGKQDGLANGVHGCGGSACGLLDGIPGHNAALPAPRGGF
jgi:hypothetical protein